MYFQKLGGDSSHGLVHIDTSLWGLGAVFQDKFYSTLLPTFIKDNERIVVFEMINILVCLRV